MQNIIPRPGQLCWVVLHPQHPNFDLKDRIFQIEKISSVGNYIVKECFSLKDFENLSTRRRSFLVKGEHIKIIGAIDLLKMYQNFQEFIVEHFKGVQDDNETGL